MNKLDLILKYFQKADQLKVVNPDYCQSISYLFRWMMKNDKADQDITTQTLNLNKIISAKIISREDAVIAGIEEISYLLKKYSKLTFVPQTIDGKSIKKNNIIAIISGSAVEILSYERTILNILQRMSGITTETNRMVRLIDNPLKITNKCDRFYLLSMKTLPFIAATRKTPWMVLDKKAVAMGGGLTHRLDLSDMILIKDNHIELIKEKYRLETNEEAIEECLDRIMNYELRIKNSKIDNNNCLIEIEVENKNEATSAIKTFTTLRADYLSSGLALRTGSEPAYKHLAIMFDNFTPSKVRSTLSNLGHLSNLSNIIFEASGGITEENIKDWANTGVDIISLGFLTHSPRSINLSLEI